MAIQMVDLNNSQQLETLICSIDEYLKTAVKNKRYEHSKRTAETAEKMCRIYGLNPRIGYLAGIAHDMCKEISSEEMRKLVSLDGMPVSELEDNKPDLLHGRAAAVLIKQKFGVEDSDVIEAIACHTFAAPGLCDLGKILFAADKIEPGRPQSTEEYRAALFNKNITEMTYSILQENIEYLERKGHSVAAASFELLEQLKKALQEK